MIVEILLGGTKQTKIEIENKKSLLKISGFYFQKDMLELESVSVPAKRSNQSMNAA